MTAEEVAEWIDRILLKQARGEKLTHKEEQVLAYGYYATACGQRSVSCEGMVHDIDMGRGFGYSPGPGP